MSKAKDGMTPENWARIKAIRQTAGRYIHKSCGANGRRRVRNAYGKYVKLERGTTYKVAKQAIAQCSA